MQHMLLQIAVTVKKRNPITTYIKYYIKSNIP